MFVPLLWGKPMNVWLGILLIVLLTLQILSGKRLIKLPFSFHRRNANLIAVVAIAHAFFGLGIWFFTSSAPPTTSVSESVSSTQTPLNPAVDRGQSIYHAQCAVCHGANGSGGSGTRLIGKTPSASYIQSNMPRNKPNSLSSDQVSDLVAYLTSLK